MEWNRSETVLLAAENCSSCKGSGLHLSRQNELEPCGCVLRAIFRACYERFRVCANSSLDAGPVSLEHGVRREGAGMWGRRNEEYVADFLLVSKRTLEPAEHAIFRYHYLLGADWRLCCRKLGMEKGRFFHAVYRIQKKLGRTFRELEPYALFPLREYFGTVVSDTRAAKIVSIESKRKPSLSESVPVKRAA